METLYRTVLKELSRREFLKHTASGLSALLLLPFHDSSILSSLPGSGDGRSPGDQAEIPTIPRMGRILGNSVGMYTRPSLSSKLVKMFFTDVVQPITNITIGDKEPAYNRIWYQINNEGYVHSGSVQPVEIRYNQPLRTFFGAPVLAEVTVPFTDTIWNLKRRDYLAYRLYYSTVFWITGLEVNSAGKSWYRIYDDKWEYDYFADATHLRIITAEDLAPISSNLPVESKRIEIHRAEQVVVAYENNQPVFMTRTATGAHFSDGDFTTPAGHYITNRKRPSRHMAAGDRAAANSYDLPGIPWVCYLTKNGISFHGTYWHNDFGKPRSHGCINLSSEAARWVYRWTTPLVPFNEETWSEDFGTGVDVI